MDFFYFQHSALLQSLGWAIAESIWQGCLLWILYYIIVGSYSNASAKLKTNLSTISLFGTFLWFIITFISKIISLESNTGNTHKILSSFQFNSLPSGNIIHNFISSIIMALPYLSVAYLFLLMIFSVKLINSFNSINFIKHNGLQKPPIEWNIFLRNVAFQISLNKKIKLWFSKYVDVPATIGFFKPVILIPIASLNKLTVNQLEAIILHEMSHIKRNDYLINLFISLVDTILFFNPFIVLMSRIIKRERENCCDDFVLQYQYDRHSYASALLLLEKSRNSDLRLALLATSGKKVLLSRIKRIMEIKNGINDYNYGQRLLAMFLVTILIYSLASFSPAKKQNEAFKKLPGKDSIAVPLQMNKIKEVLNPKNEKENIVIQKQNYKPVIILNNPKLSGDIKIDSTNNLMFSIENGDDNNVAFAYNYNNQTKAPIPSTKMQFSGLQNGANSFYTQDFDVHDFKFFDNLPESMNINELKSDIEKSRQSLSAVTWENLKNTLVERLAETRLSDININLNQNEIFTVLENEGKIIEKNIDQFRLQMLIKNKNLHSNMSMIKSLLNDSLLKKKFPEDDDLSGFYKENFDNTLYKSASKPGKIKKEIKVLTPPCPKISVIENKESYPEIYYLPKSSGKHKLQIDYKNGEVIINGEKVNSSDKLKKFPFQLPKHFSVVYNDQTD